MSKGKNIEDFNFEDLTPIKIGPFRIGEQQFVLLEADGEAARAYRKASLRGIIVNKGGRMENLNETVDAETVLVSQCLYKVDSEGNPTTRVGAEVIRKWPNRVIRPLFDKAKEISYLGEDEDSDDEENPTTDGSEFRSDSSQE